MAKEADHPPFIAWKSITLPAHDDSLIKAILNTLGCDRQHHSSGCGYLHDRCRPKAVEALNRAIQTAYTAGWEGHATAIGSARTNQQVQQLERALRIFGQHLDTCPALRRFFKRACECGFEKILKNVAFLEGEIGNR